jgi:hypothetical protein
MNNKTLQESIVLGLRELCLHSEGARMFFEWAANRQNDAAETSIDVFERKSSMDRASCIELAKDVSRIGCGQYIVGRRGSKTRVRWDYGLKSIAGAAVGKEDKLEAVDPELAAELEGQANEATVSSGAGWQQNEPLSIAEAKRRLGASLGVSVDAIDIVIRG